MVCFVNVLPGDSAKSRLLVSRSYQTAKVPRLAFHPSVPHFATISSLLPCHLAETKGITVIDGLVFLLNERLSNIQTELIQVEGRTKNADNEGAEVLHL